MITIGTGTIQVEIDPDFGAQLSVIADSEGRNALAWYDWSTPARASDGERYYDARLDWTSDYRGGWQETVPNAGVACTVEGVTHPFHGEASLARWTVVEQSATTCTLSVSTRLPLIIERRMWVDATEPVLFIEETAHNVGSGPVRLVWGHHPVFPAQPGAQIDLPPGVRTSHEAAQPSDLEQVDGLWPAARTRGGDEVDLSVIPDHAVHRLMYLAGHTDGWYAVRQPAGEHPGVALAWDMAAHPYLWFWTMRHTPEFPWYGRAAVVALEPQTSSPFDGLAGAIERGQAHTVEAGETLTTWVTLRLLATGHDPVTSVTREGQVFTA